jgi:hypothetical protein
MMSASATSSSMVPFTCEKHHGISSGEDRIAAVAILSALHSSGKYNEQLVLMKKINFNSSV